MTADIMVQRLTERDVDAFLAIRRQMLTTTPWAFAASVEDDAALDRQFVVARTREPFNVVLLATISGGLSEQVVGAIGICRQGSPKFAHRAKIWGMFVAPEYRRHGTGQALLTTAIALARTWEGVEYLDLAVSEACPEAHALYLKLGFVEWGREPGATAHAGSLLDELHMCLRL